MTDAEAINTEAEAQEATTPTEPQQEQVETFDREYVEKLRKENASYRTKAKQLEEAAEKARVEAERSKLDEVERLKAEKSDAEKAAAEARAEALRTRHLVALAGKVAGDPEDALLIAERAGLVTDEGVDVEALLKAKPYLAPTTPGSAPIDAPRGRAGRTYSDEDLKRMSPDEINQHWPEIQAARQK